MIGLIKFCTTDSGINAKRLQIVTAFLRIVRHYHIETNPSLKSSDPSGSVQYVDGNNVAIFWDLDNKPPKSVSPFDAAVRLKKAAESFGNVRYKIAYANQRSFDYVPPKIREQRKDRKALSQLENKGVVKPVQPYLCRVCGRRFYHHEKLVSHFKQIHETEHRKRVNQIESARGSQRVNLVGKYSMKMEKYNNAARDILTPKAGYGLGDELKRAGYWVSTVSNKPQAADFALRNHMIDLMDRLKMDYLILVSDDSDFVEVLKEARLRCLKTVVVGDSNDGALKRVSDAAFSWQEIIMGKAKKEAVSVVGRWKDRDVLRRLEWTYNYDREREIYGYSSEDDNDNESGDSDVKGLLSGQDVDGNKREESRAWWKLESDSEVDSS